MALTYDFDMFSIMPKEIQAQFGDMFKELGVTEKLKEQMALFRDPAAVAALQGASEDVKQCLRDSGFGINVHDSGAGPGRFPPSDGEARMNVLGRLRQNLRQLSPDADWNGFDIRAFMQAAAAARPIDTPARSLGEMRQSAETPALAPMPERKAGAVDMDSFFTAKPTDARAYATGPSEGPDLDSFFANSQGTRSAKGAGATDLMESVRANYDAPLPRKNKSVVMMVGLAVGLYILVTAFGGDGFISKLAPAAQMVSTERN